MLCDETIAPERDQMADAELCQFPGCSRPMAAPPPGGGRPSRYCELSEHTAQTAFRERKRLTAFAEPDDDGEQGDGRGERPVSLAAASLRTVVDTFHRDLDRALEAVDVLRGAEHLEAELASVRADAQAMVGQAEQRAALAERSRVQADEAAEAAIEDANATSARAAADEGQATAAAAARAQAEARAEDAGRASAEAQAAAEAARARGAHADQQLRDAETAHERAEASAQDALAERDEARAGARRADEQ